MAIAEQHRLDIIAFLKDSIVAQGVPDNSITNEMLLAELWDQWENVINAADVADRDRTKELRELRRRESEVEEKLTDIRRRIDELDPPQGVSADG